MWTEMFTSSQIQQRSWPSMTIMIYFSATGGNGAHDSHRKVAIQCALSTKYHQRSHWRILVWGFGKNRTAPRKNIGETHENLTKTATEVVVHSIIALKLEFLLFLAEARDDTAISQLNFVFSCFSSLGYDRKGRGARGGLLNGNRRSSNCW